MTRRRYYKFLHTRGYVVFFLRLKVNIAILAHKILEEKKLRLKGNKLKQMTRIHTINTTYPGKPN